MTVYDELGRIGIGLEAELLGDKPKLDIRFVSTTVSAGSPKRWEETHALHMLQRAASRSRATNISIRYAPILGVSR